MEQLNNLLLVWQEKLISEVRIKENQLDALVQTLHSEAQDISPSLRIDNIEELELDKRLIELNAFHESYSTRSHEELKQLFTFFNNLCFTSLNDEALELIKQNTKAGTLLRKVSKYLLSKSIREFREAISNKDWQLHPEGTELEYKSNTSDWRSDSTTMTTLSFGDLFFWQTLSLTIVLIVFSPKKATA